MGVALPYPESVAARQTAEGASALRWTGVPSLRDARLPFLAILVVYVAMGTLWLGFNRNPLQVALIVASACLFDMALHFTLRRRELLFPLSACITSLSLAILLNYSHDYLILFLPVFLSIGSKYLFTYRGAHVFNPSLFGVVVTLVFAGDIISAAPAYQWGGSWGMSVFIVTAALTLFVFRVGRGWLVASFLVFYALQTALRAYLMRMHLPPEMLFLGTLSAPPFFLFTFFMITDPKTSPSTPKAQVGVAFAIALVDLVLHTRESVFTFFYAAAIVATARFLWRHAREAGAAPLEYLRKTLFTPRVGRASLVLGLIGGTGIGAYSTALRPHVGPAEAGLMLQDVGNRSGIDMRIDRRALSLVDPRLQHISKWLLSVGASVQTGDVNNDGLPDLFFTSPLAQPTDRASLWLNRGQFRFERVTVPALQFSEGDPRTVGLTSGGLFFDYDSDGDQDLLVLQSFGETRLLRNTLEERGSLNFTDVSKEAGAAQYAISVSANVLDYDRDGRPDLLIANVLSPTLREYGDSTKLNVFALPAPRYPHDRRMFRFMHNGWHNADNGGQNVLLRNRGNGTFESVDVAAMGMPETHWSLSVGTGDLNDDGWTDLYIANDFGPDDLYLNEAGRRFRRVQRRFFGEIGRDTYKGMNSSLADFDRDGRLDIYVSNVHHALQSEGSLLWMNRGTSGADGVPRLRDEATSRGALNEDRFGWGAGVADLTNSGWVDIVQANGMVDDRLDDVADGCPDYWYVNHKLMQSPAEIHTYADMWGDLRGRCIFPNEARRVYLNRGVDAHPQFVDVAQRAGLRARENSRGVATVDLDNDGRLDLVIANQHSAPTILRNSATTGTSTHAWIGLRLVGDGRRCHRDAFGSSVMVRMPDSKPQRREAQAANGFSAQHDTRIHFGLGAGAPSRVPVSVRWCGGETTRYDLEIGKYQVVQQ